MIVVKLLIDFQSKLERNLKCCSFQKGQRLKSVSLGALKEV